MNYQGWANYGTWCVNLWLTNEEGSNNWLKGLANSSETDHQKVRQLKETIEQLNPLGDAGLFSDLLNAAIGEVDWLEIIQNHREEEMATDADLDDSYEMIA